MNTAAPDLLATKLAEAALTVLVRTCRQEVAAASRDDLEAACAAMRAQARPVIDRLLDDARAAPWVAEAAFHAAALELARAGIAVLRPR
ncbi:hypothetical protein [Silanimonas lenta]|uniref:hypothetical protein n=1 Tax=Silanimonas lenta TaxID=265429 RepID=UPI000406890D|nr:hypothetical protein [Silanimonas lenta]